ncbi:MAG: CopD family protein [Hyphomicrobiaceae bacterium]
MAIVQKGGPGRLLDRKADWAVAVLVVAGSVTLAALTDSRFDPPGTYQFGFALKLAAFVAILLLAAVNHLKWTPLLKSDFARARRGLQRSISYEVFVALVVLAATAVAISFAPSAL